MKQRLSLTLALVTGLAACSGAARDDGDPAVAVVARSPQCGSGAGALQWVDDAATAREHGAPLTAERIEGIDWSARALLLYRAGQRPTAGYRLSLVEARRANGGLELTVREATPGADTLTAQVITHPCLVVSVPRSAYPNVRVTAPDGSVLGRLRAPR